MSDGELARLERAVAENGDAASRLRLSRALERVGRRDDALAVLLAGKEHADVRREIGPFPAWRHSDGDLAGTRHADVRPLRENPRLRWRLQERTRPPLLASPLGLVTRTRDDDDLVLLEPDTGRARAFIDRPFSPTIRGDVVLGRAQGALVVAHDLWTGELLHETLVPRMSNICGELVLVRSGDDQLSALDFSDPRRPVGKEVWREKVKGTAFPVEVTQGLVLLRLVRGFAALDARTGHTLWARPEAIHATADGDDVVAVDPWLTRVFESRTGKLRWDREGQGARALLGNELVVVMRTYRESGGFVILERAEGKLLGAVELGEALAVARDTVFGVANDRVVAWTAEGRERWSFPRHELVHLGNANVALAQDRVYVFSYEGGGIACLEGSP